MDDAALGTLRSIREHAVQIQAARADLAEFHRQIRGADTAQKAAELQGTVQTYQAQEAQLLRQTALLRIDQEARAQAERAPRRRPTRSAAPSSGCAPSRSTARTATRPPTARRSSR